jgi:uncharacterized membrane protein
MVPKKIKIYLVALVIVLAIDLTWVLVVMKSFYAEQFSAFARPEIIPFWSAALAWLLIPLGIVLFVHQLSKNNKQSLLYGALYGLILYGVYDFTNYATLAGWTLTLVVIDILWGTVLCAVSSLLLRIIMKRWRQLT